MGLIHWGIIGGQGPKSGVNSLGYHWGPGAKKWGLPQGNALYWSRFVQTKGHNKLIQTGLFGATGWTINHNPDD